MKNPLYYIDQNVFSTPWRKVTHFGAKFECAKVSDILNRSLAEMTHSNFAPKQVT